MKETFKSRVTSSFVTPLIAGTVLTVLAPLGTGNFSFAYRAVYWIGLCFAGGLGAMVGQYALARFVPDVSTLIRTLVQSATATLAVAPFVLFLSAQISPIGVLLTLFYIWVIAVVITSVAELAGRKTMSETPDGPSRPPLMDRLPIGMRDATLYGVTSEDHYVRVHTSSGEHMLLMRLADVDALAQPLAGLSPHRSWWVAEDGVESVTRKDGKLTIRLKDATDVPVSRAGAARVKDAGWLT